MVRKTEQIVMGGGRHDTGMGRSNKEKTRQESRREFLNFIL